MAQFKFQDKSDIEQERAKAIETLIPGTIHYFHLYFLNLVKTKRTRKEWTKEQKDLWLQFDERFGTSEEFYEVETWLNVIHPLEALPEASEDLSKQDQKNYMSMIEYIKKYYMKMQERDIDVEMPDYMKEQDIPGQSSSDNEDVEGELSQKVDSTVYTKYIKF